MTFFIHSFILIFLIKSLKLCTDKSAAGREQGPVPEDLCATGQLYR